MREIAARLVAVLSRVMECSHTFKCKLKVVPQLVKTALSSPNIALDQEQPGTESRTKFVHEAPETSPKEVSLDGAAYPASNRVRDGEIFGRIGRLDVENPDRSSSSLGGGRCQPRELPTGADPSRHVARPSGSGDPCCDGP